MVGFVCDLFAFSIGLGGNRGAEGAHIAGFTFWLVATILILCYVFLDECNGNKIILICFVVFAFIAGLATVAGVAIWGGFGTLRVYSPTVGCTGALLEILAGIFGILELVGVSPK